MKFARQSGGRGQYGHVVINVAAAGAGRRLRVREQDRRRLDPQGVHPARSTRASRSRSARACSPAIPVVDIKVELIDGSLPRGRLVGDGVQDRRLHGDQGGPAQGAPVLLEPMMAVEVVTPEEFMGDVIGDLNRRRGHIESMEPRGNAQVVRAKVPLSEMFGYSTDLRSKTQGRAVYSMQFKAYEQVPKSVAEEIVSKVGGNA